jgi:hypothetical protein
VAAVLQDGYVATFRQVGQFRVVKRVRRLDRNDVWTDKQGGNVVSYFCTADGKVVHFLVGPVEPNTRHVVHAILAQRPDVSLSEIEAVVFELLAGQTFEPRSKRQDEILASVKLIQQRGLPTLLIVTDLGQTQPDFVLRAQRNPVLQKSEGYRSLVNEMDHFNRQTLTLRELTALMDDLQRSPVKMVRNGHVQFVVLDERGRTKAVTLRGDPFSTAVRLLNRARMGSVERANEEPKKLETQASPQAQGNAARQLKLAKLLNDKNPAASKRRLQRILADYPRSAAAREAEQLLAEFR